MRMSGWAVWSRLFPERAVLATGQTKSGECWRDCALEGEVLV
jgi:hypothetical protein